MVMVIGIVNNGSVMVLVIGIVTNGTVMVMVMSPKYEMIFKLKISTLHQFHIVHTALHHHHRHHHRQYHHHQYHHLRDARPIHYR